MRIIIIIIKIYLYNYINFDLLRMNLNHEMVHFLHQLSGLLTSKS